MRPACMQWLSAALVVTGASMAVAQAIQADYVVVGGGTAGCAMAARLCEGLPNAQVVLLERSSPRSPQAEFEVRAMRNYFQPLIDNDEVVEKWDSTANPGLGGRTLDILAGKTIGGSSSINAAQFSTPTNAVAASWGINGLSAATAGRLYNKVRAQLGVAQPPPELTQSYLPEYYAANEQNGGRIIAPPEKPTGADEDTVWLSYLAVTQGGMRVDSATGYLDPVKNGVCSGNLNIIQGATVTKVLLSGDRATGVQFSQGGQIQEVQVGGGEVIMSAGPYHSAKLLQLSGIGPSGLLNSLGIPVVADLPVGESAQSRAFDQLLAQYTGVPNSAGGDDAAAATPEAREQFDAGNGGLLGFARAQINGIFDAPISAWRTMSFLINTGQPTFQAACIPNPKGRAQVIVKSTDPFDTPMVNTDILGTVGEAEQLAACLMKERQIINSLPGNFQLNEIAPGGGPITAARVRESAGNDAHFVGANGVGLVVDGDLKVFGYENLRVVDASAIPDIPPNSGPAGSVYMIAEHISEMIIAGGGPTGGGGGGGGGSPPAVSPPAAAACGNNGQPVCTGTEFECNFGFVGAASPSGRVCVPWQPPGGRGFTP